MSSRGNLSGDFPPLELSRGFVDWPGLTRVRFSHPPGATNLPVFVSGPGGMEPNFDEFVRGVEAAFPDKEANFVVGCRSGVRSLTAGALMQEAGYTGAVLNVEGGFLDWEGRGLEVER